MAFKSRRFPSTLVAYQKKGHKEVWFILTDLPPEICNACWYGMRSWIEQGFRTIKRGGWQWHGTRMTNPKRAQRLWLAVSVSTLWILSVGGEAEINTEMLFPDIVDSLEQYVPNPKPHPKRKAARLRLVSIFRRGWMAILVSFIRHEPLPLGRFIPEPWSISVHEPLQNNTLGVAA